MNADGEQQYHYYFVEVMATGRTVQDPKPYMTDDLTTLRHHSVLVTAPSGNLRGASFLNRRSSRRL